MKHYYLLLLAFIASMQLSAQVEWKNPMAEPECCISGRAWNAEMGQTYHRIPDRFQATLPFVTIHHLQMEPCQRCATRI